MDKILPTRPSGYGNLIKRSIKLYNAGFTKVFPLSLILSIIVFIPRLISDVTGQTFYTTPPALNGWSLWPAILNFVALIFFIGIIWHMYCVARGTREPLFEDMQVGIKKVAYVFLATIIQTAIVISVIILMYGFHLFFQRFLMQQNQLFSMGMYLHLAAISLILLVEFFVILYLSIIFIFLAPLIAIENKGVVGSLERSVYLSWNHWWRVFTVQFTPWLCYFFILNILKYWLHIDVHIYFLEQGGTYALSASIINILVFAIFVPWIPAILVVQLKDLELRKKITR